MKKRFWLLPVLVLAGGLTVTAAVVSRDVIPPPGPGAPKVYLTFDDGPSKNTPRVLDMLAEYDVKGTFFVVGRSDKAEIPLYRRIVEEGHAIGIHSFSHNTNEIYRSFDAFYRDFRAIENWIYDQTGVRSTVCRVPGGTYSRLLPGKLRTEILDFFTREGYACFDWDIDPGDSGPTATPARQIVATVQRQAEKKKGEPLVVLLHDDGLRTTLPTALPKIIRYFQKQGYDFDVLTDRVMLSGRRA